jgi:hypothetical protein
VSSACRDNIGNMRLGAAQSGRARVALIVMRMAGAARAARRRCRCKRRGGRDEELSFFSPVTGHDQSKVPVKACGIQCPRDLAAISDAVKSLSGDAIVTGGRIQEI